MKENGLYIFIMAQLQDVGGMQMYFAGISMYLEKMGFEVICLFPGNNYGVAEIPSIQKYLRGGSQMLQYLPQQFEVCDRRQFINWIYDLAKHKIEDYQHIYVESSDDRFAMWGEYIASQINGVHICFPLNEIYDTDKKIYEKTKSFWRWKYIRSEVYGRQIANYIWGNKLREVDPDWEEKKGWCYEREPIEDIRDVRVENITECDINIAYIGRGDKEYVTEMILQLEKFADKHSDKSVQIVFVGNMINKSTIILNRLCTKTNIKILFLGNMVPIPKKLFSKVDVVLANSQTAFYSAHEDVPVIVIDSKSYMALGVMGIDYIYQIGGRLSINAQENDKITSISQALENILINREYEGKKAVLPLKNNPEKIYKRALDAFRNAEKNERVYYQIDDYHFPKVDFKSIYHLNKIINENNGSEFRFDMLKEKRIAVFGCGNEGRWLLGWMAQNKLEPQLIVDNKSDLWGSYIEDKKISSPDELKSGLVDFVIIANVKNVSEIVNQIKMNGFGDEDYYTSEYIRNWTFVNQLKYK